MKDWELIAEAARMIMDAFKRKNPRSSLEIDLTDQHQFEVFMGSLLGAIEAIGIITEKEDRMTHSKIINALERLVYR
tara:strand:- start:193 stop:423 length:231 start_codon:yes stop_codon:yes gene_type:complete